MKRLLCLWFPHWAAQQACRQRPRRRGKPVLVYRPRTARGERVLACSPEAAEQGVRPGMSLSEAAARLERSSVFREGREELGLVLPHDPLADRRALRELACWCERFSPLVALEEAEFPECLLLEVTRLAPLFHGEAALLEQAARACAEQQQLRVRAALADTVGAAWGLAHFSPHSPCLQPPGDHRLIETLPLAALRLPESLPPVLEQLGLENIGQLRRLPRAALATRFGPELLRRLDQFTGLRAEPLRGERAELPLRAAWNCEPPLIRPDALERVIAHLLAQLTPRLKAKQLGVLRLHCRLECERADPLDLESYLFRPQAEPRYLLELLGLQLEQRVLPGPVRRIELAFPLTAPCAWRQQSLFDAPTQGKAAAAWPLLLDRLASRLGRERVLRACCRPDPDPARSCAFFPPDAETGGSKVGGGLFAAAAREKLPPRPLQLYPEPVPLARTELTPEGAPLRFLLDGRWCTVGRSWGPERIQTGWWRGSLVQRDYHRVELLTGERYWIFHRLTDHRWFLHGVFA